MYDELRVLSLPVPTGSVLMSPHSRLSLTPSPPLSPCQVYEELRVLSPPVPTGSVLMSPHSRLSLRTSLPAVAASAEGLVSVSGQELVAGPRTGRDTVRLTATGQPGGNQTAVLLLELLPVHYIMVTPVAELCVADGATSLPTGLTVHGVRSVNLY